MGNTLKGPVRLDDKHRVVLTKEIREAAGIGRDGELVAIPFWGGVVIASPRGRAFAGSLSGFGFEEGKHEATAYVLREAADASPGHGSAIRRRR